MPARGMGELIDGLPRLSRLSRREMHREGEFEGIGVGPVSVRTIIDRHGGRIWVEGEQGKGAAFYFTLDS